jgi:hypothetical protein
VTKLLEVVSYYFLTRGEGLYCFIRCVRTSNDLHGTWYTLPDDDFHGTWYKLPDDDFRVKMVHKKTRSIHHCTYYLFHEGLYYARSMCSSYSRVS